MLWLSGNRGASAHRLGYVEAEQREDRRRDIHQHRGVAQPQALGGAAGNDKRNLEDPDVFHASMAFVESAMVGDEDDGRLIPQPRLAEPVDEAPDVGIDVAGG